MHPSRIAAALGAAAVAAVLALGTALAADAPRMSGEQLNARLGEPGLVVIDTRRGGDWSSSDAQVKGALRRDPNAVAAWADEFQRGQTLVVYCA